MKTQRTWKRMISLCLATAFLLSLFPFTVSAEAAGGTGLYQETEQLTTGIESLLVAEYEGAYYALALEEGSITPSAQLLEVTDGRTSASDLCSWILDDDSYLANKGISDTYLYAGSAGLMTYSSGRSFTYDPATRHALMHQKYWLTFDGEGFSMTNNENEASEILIFRKMSGYIRTDTLDAGYPYVIAAEYDGRTYALWYDGTAQAREIQVENDAVDPDGLGFLWIPDEEAHLESACSEGVFLFPYSGGLTYSSGRIFSYVDGHLCWTNSSGIAYLTFDGETFAYTNGDSSAAADILLFRSEAPSSPLAITVQPEDYIGPENSTAVFTLEAAGTEPLSYLWYIQVPGSDGFVDSGVAEPVYVELLEQENSGQQLYCVVTDALGNSVQSDTVTMLIEEDIVASGDCGDQLSWTLDRAGLLTISGYGDMWEFADGGTPWNEYMDAVTAVVIEPGVTSVSSYAFNYCGSLAEVSIPDGLYALGHNVFSNTAIRSIALTADITVLAEEALGWMPMLEEITVPEDNPAFCSVDGVLFNKDMDVLLQYPPSKEGTEYVVPDGVREIGVCAFVWCGQLTYISLPDGLESLGDCAFWNCSNLQRLDLPGSLNQIGRWSMGLCWRLEEVSIPGENDFYASIDGVLYLESMKELILYPAFSQRPEFVVPDGVERIGDYAFAYASGLNAISLPHTLKSIGYSAFLGCDTLTDVDYAGAELEWACLSIDTENEPLLNAEMHFAHHGPVTGICGADLSWTLDVDGILSISGAGIMDDYSPGGAPWNSLCSRITEVSISDSVTHIGSYAFMGCTNVESIHIPASVTTIGIAAFVDDIMLRSITVSPDNPCFCSLDGVLYDSELTRLVCYPGGREAESYTVPDGVTSIAKDAFNNNYFLSSVSLPDSLQVIEEYAFTCCTALESIAIPDGVAAIEISTFNNCWNLISITIPASVTAIRDSAFFDCSGLMEVYFGGSELDWAAIDIEDFNDDLINAALIYMLAAPLAITTQPTDYIGAAGSTAVFTLEAVGPEPLSYQWYIKNVSASRFSKSSIKSPTYTVTLTELNSGRQLYCVVTDADGNTVQSDTVIMRLAEEVASGSCGDDLVWTLDETGLLTIAGTGDMEDYLLNAPWYSSAGDIQRIQICEGVASIGSYAFMQCSSVSEVSLPLSLRSIGDYAFSSCSSLREIAIPEGVRSIGEAAFQFTGLKQAEIPAAVTEVGDGAFSACFSLSGIDVEEGNQAFTSVNGVLFDFEITRLISYPAGRFSGYEIPYGVREIAAGAFYYAFGLSSVTIPDSVESIGRNAFNGCFFLSRIEIPASVASIDYGVFGGTAQLTEICVAEDNPAYCSVDGVLFSKDMTVLIGYPGGKAGSYTVPDGVQKIASYAFSNQTNLTEIIFNAGLEEIDSLAFVSCSNLRSMRLPSSLSTVRYMALRVQRHYQRFLRW